MQFGLIEMWQQMGAVAKTVAIILIALSIITIYLFIERQLAFSRARKKSMEVAPKLADLLKNGQLKEAMALASKKEFKDSHLARVTASGIEEFLTSRLSNLTVDEQLESAQRGCERAQSLFTQELRKGLSVMATIATSAPFIGLFGTIFGIINAFRGMALTGSGGIGAVAGGIAEALITTAFGIAVAIIALWTFNSLNTRIEIYNAEMENTASQITDYFVRMSESR
ncbi:MAG: MotA/TolQ/ExbB proton channel family protein [Acidobacteriota bacterium]|nr:MotA/TolQ/ExbB proton channel family protein [Acidobacteriota bacterium]